MPSKYRTTISDANDLHTAVKAGSRPIVLAEVIFHTRVKSLTESRSPQHYGGPQDLNGAHQTEISLKYFQPRPVFLLTLSDGLYAQTLREWLD